MVGATRRGAQGRPGHPAEPDRRAHRHHQRSGRRLSCAKRPGGATATENISTIAKNVRATLDAQAKAAAAAGKELVFDPGRKTGQQADLSSFDGRSLAAISLNQDGLFSKQESFAAKQTLDSRARASILSALKQSQSSGDPTQLSLGILNTYSSISVEERQAINWTPAFRDSLVANYKSSSQILSILRG